MVFLAVAANSLVPLVSTAVEWRPLTYRLASPVDTYLHCSLFGLTLLVANALAIRYNFSGARRNCNRSRFSIRDVLTSREIFYVALLGFLTLALRLVASSLLPEVARKVLAGAGFLPLAIFVLAVPPHHRVTFSRHATCVMLLLCWLLYAGIGITSRKAVVMPIAVVLFGWFMARAFRRAPISQRVLSTVFLAAPLVLTFITQATAISDAILAERAYRQQRSVLENLGATFSTYLDANKLQRFRDYRESRLLPPGMRWREDYIRNPFAARFTTVKQCDNLITAMKRQKILEPTRRNVLKDTWARVLAQFPGPLFSIFFPHMDKGTIISSSMGDVMAYNLGLIAENRIGSKLTGSAAAHSFLTLGWWYPLALLPLYLTLFTCLYAIANATGGGGVSTLSQIIVFDVFTDMNIEGWHYAVSFLFRGFWQTVLLYAVAVAVARMLARGKQQGLACGAVR